MAYTTIRVSESTKKKLEEEKDHPRETYEEVVEELLAEKDRRLKEKIEKAKERGEYYSLEEIKEEHGLV